MFNIGPIELMIVLLLALVVVGPSRLPEVGRSIGRGLRELRKVQDEVRDSINFDLDGEPAAPRSAPKPRAPRRTRAAEESAVPPTPIEPEPPVPGEVIGGDTTADAALEAPVLEAPATAAVPPEAEEQPGARSGSPADDPPRE